MEREKKFQEKERELREKESEDWRAEYWASVPKGTLGWPPGIDKWDAPRESTSESGLACCSCRPLGIVPDHLERRDARHIGILRPDSTKGGGTLKLLGELEGCLLRSGSV